MKLPAAHLPELAHQGSLRREDKGTQSWEGHGLSVCRPDDMENWSSIARLGGRPVWKLHNPEARFLDFHALNKAQRRTITSWGIAAGLAGRAWRWSYSYFDDELDRDCSTLHATKQEALEQAADADGDSTDVRRKQVLCPTPALSEALHGVQTFEDCLDLLAVVYAERKTDLDGVWWEDEHGPLSAPRGVILPGRLQRFTVTRAQCPT